MTIDTDLATLHNPWGLMPDVVEAAAKRVEAELAREQEATRAALKLARERNDALETAERELARLQEGLRRAAAALDDAIKAAVNADWSQDDYDEWDAARVYIEHLADAEEYSRALLAEDGAA